MILLTQQIVPIPLLDEVIVQVLPGELHRHELKRLPGQRGRTGPVAGCNSRRRTIDPLRITKGRAWFVLDFEAVQTTVVEKEAKDDGQHRRHAPGPNDYSPYAVHNNLALFSVLCVNAALHGL